MNNSSVRRKSKGVKAASTLSPKAYRVQSIDRAVGILRLLAVADRPMELSEVAGEMGLHASTTHRFLVSLLRHGLILRTIWGRYLIASDLNAVVARRKEDARP